MPQELSWYLEGRVIYARLSGALTAEDARAFDRMIIPYFDSAQTPLVHMIGDFSGVERMPGIGVLASSFQWPKHPKVGWVVGFPKANAFVSVITGIVAQIFRARYRQVNTLEEALTFLQDVDSTLPDLTSVAASKR